jgi:hypothetical protein
MGGMSHTWHDEKPIASNFIKNFMSGHCVRFDGKVSQGVERSRRAAFRGRIAV